MPKFKQQIDEKSLALTMGILLAVMHLAWLVVVAAGYGQSILNWIFGMHLVSLSTTVLPFNYMTAIGLLIVTFIAGYVLGWVFAYIWNWAIKRK